MTVVTIAEAREQLPELLQRMAAGEQIVIADGGKWLAALSAPPPPSLTAEEEAERQRAAMDAFQKWTEDMRRWCAEDGVPFLPDEEAGTEAFKSESPAA